MNMTIVWILLFFCLAGIIGLNLISNKRYEHDYLL